MDDSAHVFLIKDKIRCIQKKIMDQLAADLNSALNDANILTSSVSNVTVTSSGVSKSRRRRRRPVNNGIIQPNLDASDSTTPENTGEILRYRRHDHQSIVSDGDEGTVMPWSKQTQSLATASESDSTSQTDALRRRRRPFKKPITPVTIMSPSATASSIKLTRCPSTRVDHLANGATATPIRRRRRNCRSDGNLQLNELDDDPSTPSSSSSFSFAMNHPTYAGKRKRSRAIHDDYRIRNGSLHEYDMTAVDETTLTNLSSSSSLNLSESDQEPCLTSNEADDEQSDWPREESSVPRLISWWEENKSDDGSDHDEKMLTTTDGALQKIVNGALSMMLASSKSTIQNRIKNFVHREMLTGNRRHAGSKNAYSHLHSKRHVRLLKETRRSHHHSYSHKRVKSEHFPTRPSESAEPIDAMNIGHQLLEKIGWTPGHGLGLNRDGITTPVQINFRHYRQGLGYENTPMDTGERPETEPTPSLPSQSTQV